MTVITQGLKSGAPPFSLPVEVGVVVSLVVPTNIFRHGNQTQGAANGALRIGKIHMFLRRIGQRISRNEKYPIISRIPARLARKGGGPRYFRSRRNDFENRAGVQTIFPSNPTFPRWDATGLSRRRSAAAVQAAFVTGGLRASRSARNTKTRLVFSDDLAASRHGPLARLELARKAD